MALKKSFGNLGIAAALFVLWSASSFAKPSGNLRYTVVVDEFENKTESPRALGNEWSTLLTTKLHESGSFIVVGQTSAQLAALKEQLRGASGLTAQGKKTAVRGQMTPAQLLVQGVITHINEGSADQGGGIGVGKFRVNAGRKKTEIRATLQMIDATTGALVAAKNFVGIAQQRSFGLQQSDHGTVNMGQDNNVHEAFEKAISDAIPWMVAQLPSVPWRGTVVKVDKQSVIVNRGSREGVTAGDEFIVGESELLRDPDNGDVLDEIVHERARLRVDKVNERTSVCSVIDGTIGQIVERMGIQYKAER
ncbi:MAG TPA: CsgG/HfaB family protein [Thermoanaerobaculia bacterium]